MFHILTRCSRLDNLETIKKSVFKDGVDIIWHLIFDTNRLKDIPADLLESLSDDTTRFHFVKSEDGDYLYPQMGYIASKLSGWVVVVDDDNIIHPEFYNELLKVDKTQPYIYVVNQIVDGKDFTGLQIREAKAENMKYQGVDIAQLVFHSSIFKRYNFTGHYAGDGFLINEIYSKEPDIFHYIQKELCYYNYLEKPKKGKVPKVLFINKEPIKLKSYKAADYEDDSLEVLHKENDNGIAEIIGDFKPDSIITISKDWKDFPELANQPLQIRNKWITLEEVTNQTGELAYNCAMTTMLNMDNSQLISYFTPIYNTGKRLLTTYKSLQNQTYNNWEWVLVNDSSDGGVTLKIAEEIAKNDPRVKVYDFREKSKGIIGESKYRAASLCKGYLLCELDHDDYLTTDCTYWLWKASQEHPEIGFFYTDNAEVDEEWKALTYTDGFAFGYGRYEDVVVDGKEFKSCPAPNINPKTIRHIVGVPNHIRTWRRDVYFQIGGHNRDLAIADDYELVIRTFLGTTMMRIPKMCYVQFIYNNHSGQNTHDLSRADIQRRVRTIMYHYNDRIAKRFTDLGIEDYCYTENKNYPLNVPSRFGDKENYVNKVYSI